MRRRSPSVPWLAGVLATLVVIVAAAIFAVGAIRWRSADDGEPLPPDVGVVDFVIDGDTIDIEIAGTTERVRLIGIDTPETYVEDGPPECFGPEASAHTSTLLPEGTEVRLVRDIVGRDDYGRLLAYVYRLDDDLFVNEAIVAFGFARPLTIPPNDAFASRFVAAATTSEAGDLGLWGGCGG